MKKASIIIIAALSVTALAISVYYLNFSLNSFKDRSPKEQTVDNLGNISEEERINLFAENIVSGGPPKDGIPPIDNPKYISIADSSDFLNDQNVVFVFEQTNPPKIFPQKILVWHEIVNDKVDGKNISISYCPLTGSAIGFNGKVEGSSTTFGTSGKLLNSNLVMYDRKTESYWPQILGQAVKGKSVGEKLEMLPVIWTTWELAKERYPNALVLSKDTGYIRQYGRDPYGSYADQKSYYYSGGPIFPVIHENKRLPPKEVVIGIIDEESQLAITKKFVKENAVINEKVGETPIVAIYDKDLDAVRVYKSINKSEALSFYLNNGYIYDKETNSKWNTQGKAIEGKLKGASLEWVPSFDVMWFAWAAFYPDTKLVQ